MISSSSSTEEGHVGSPKTAPRIDPAAVRKSSHSAMISLSVTIDNDNNCFVVATKEAFFAAKSCGALEGLFV